MKKFKITAGALTTLVLVVACGVLAQQSAPVGRAEAGPKDTSSEYLVNHQEKAPVAEPKTLLARTQFGQRFQPPHAILEIAANFEGTSDKEKRKVYGLSSITVPAGGWTVTSVAIYTAYPEHPDKWLKLAKARLNIFPKKKGKRPAADDDPERGREIKVSVRKNRQEKDGKGKNCDVFEVRASNLKLNLEPGDYWIGLTPIISYETTSQGMHLYSHPVDPEPRFEDVARNPDEDFMPEWSEWRGIGDGTPRYLSILLEGQVGGGKE
jgi:hypothetical protein